MKPKQIKKILALLEYLDGQGLILTDDDLIKKALKNYTEEVI